MNEKIIVIDDSKPSNDKLQLENYASRYGAFVYTKNLDIIVDVHWLSSVVYFSYAKNKYYFTHNLGYLISLLGDFLIIDKNIINKYYLDGESYDNRNMFENVVSIYPGNTLTINNSSTRITQNSPSVCRAKIKKDINSLENAICVSIREEVKNKNVAFTLSGGVDSTLLVALAKAHNLVDKVVCYVADTGRGNDIDFSRKAARDLNVELREIRIPFDKSALEQHKKMVSVSGTPISFIGNALGFSFVAKAVKDDSFDAIVDGTGSDQIFAGTYKTHGINWYKFCLLSGEKEKARTFYNYCRSNSLLSDDELNKLDNHIFNNDNYSEYLYDQITKKYLQLWMSQHGATSICNNIKIITPYLSEDIAGFIFSEIGCFFESGINKYRLRKILSKYVSKEVAWRVDNQGLRLKPSDISASNKSEIKDNIQKNKSDILKYISWSEYLKCNIGLKKQGQVDRLYQLAVFFESIRDKH